VKRHPLDSAGEGFTRRIGVGGLQRIISLRGPVGPMTSNAASDLLATPSCGDRAWSILMVESVRPRQAVA
jgi:hypothetical protein